MKTIYVWTGLWRPPLLGECYQSKEDGHYPCMAGNDFQEDEPRWILDRQEIPDPEKEVSDAD